MVSPLPPFSFPVVPETLSLRKHLSTAMSIGRDHTPFMLDRRSPAQAPSPSANPIVPRPSHAPSSRHLLFHNLAASSICPAEAVAWRATVHHAASPRFQNPRLRGPQPAMSSWTAFAYTHSIAATGQSFSNVALSRERVGAAQRHPRQRHGLLDVLVVDFRRTPLNANRPGGHRDQGRRNSSPTAATTFHEGASPPGQEVAALTTSPLAYFTHHLSEPAVCRSVRSTRGMSLPKSAPESTRALAQSPAFCPNP